MELDLSIDAPAWICAALNVLLNVRFDIEDGATISEVMTNLTPDYAEDRNNEEKMVHTDYYLTMQRMLKASKILGGLVISKQSWQMGYHRDGLQAAVFTGKIGCFVAIRGTGPGEWNDNAVALSGRPQVNAYYQYNRRGRRVGAGVCEEVVSAQQAQALDYFSRAAAEMGWKKPNSVTVTGHSKGGNKALLITLRSPLVKVCYNFFGQGFAPEALEQFARELGEAEYRARCAKMYLICSFNDFVNPLGAQVVPPEHMVRLNMVKVAYMRQYHEATCIIGDDGGFMPRRDIGDISAAVGNIWRELKNSRHRERVSMAVMTLCGLRYGNGTPINGEYVSNRILFSSGGAAMGVAIKALAGMLLEAGVNAVPEKDRKRISHYYAKMVKPGTEAVKASSFGKLVGRTVERLRAKRQESDARPLRTGSNEPSFKVEPNSLQSGAVQLSETRGRLQALREQMATEKARVANLAERLETQERQLALIEQHLVNTADLFVHADRELAQVAAFVFALPTHGSLAELYPVQPKDIEPATQKTCGDSWNERVRAIAEETLEAGARFTRDNESINGEQCVDDLLAVSSVLQNIARKL